MSIELEKEPSKENELVVNQKVSEASCREQDEGSACEVINVLEHQQERIFLTWTFVKSLQLKENYETQLIGH